MSDRYTAADLTAFATALLERAGLARTRAAAVAEILVEADLMGHTTHGLQLLGGYLGELEGGRMARDGDPEVIADRGSAVTWDGRRLPGPWLVLQAMELASERIDQGHPTATVVVRRSHHIACLAAYLKRATDRGLIMLLMSSDPAAGSVAPFGSSAPRYTPNPIAAGFPTEGDPVLLDVSMSTTTNGLTGRLRAAGGRLPGPWLIDSGGAVSDDPEVLFADPPGAILPLGGIDLGHKGFALGLLVEALTSALGGYGRADHPSDWGASVFLQIIDPAAFGGLGRFRRETEWLAATCREAPPFPSQPPVRLPGARALARRAAMLRDGVELFPTIMPALQPWSDGLGVPRPTPLA